MRTVLALLFLLACSSTQAQELSVWQGKGVNHYANNDNTMIMLRGDAADLGPFKTYTEGGLGLATVVSSDYGRAFTSFHYGKQIEYQLGVFVMAVSAGGALASRTADGPEYAVAPYATIFVGVRYAGISAGFAHWGVYQPNLHTNWVGPNQEAGARYPTALFTGFRIGIDLDVKRK